MGMQLHKLNAALAKAKDDMKPVDVDFFLGSKGFTPGQIKYVKDVASKSGIVEQDGNYSYVPKQAGREFLSKFIADPEHNVNLGRISMAEIDAQRGQIAQALADPKLKPEEAQKLKAQDAELANKRTDIYARTKMSQQEFDAKNKPVQTNEWSEPYEASVGGKKAMVQKNLATGQIKPVMQDVSTTVKVNVGGGRGSGDGLTKDAISKEGMTYTLTGKIPFTGMGGMGRKEIMNESAKIAKEHGWTPQMVLRMQSDYKAKDRSMAAQRKSYDAMNGFVINMDKQMKRLEDVYAKLPRTQYRLLNIPIAELRSRAQGSGEEAAASAILIELGNESGKLSTNSGASIRELSESAQKQWAKIHDNKLSYNELKKVLQTTYNLGHDRLASTQSAMDFTLNGIESIGATQSAPSGGFDMNAITAELNRRKGK